MEIDDNIDGEVRRTVTTDRLRVNAQTSSVAMVQMTCNNFVNGNCPQGDRAQTACVHARGSPCPPEHPLSSPQHGSPYAPPPPPHRQSLWEHRLRCLCRQRSLQITWWITAWPHTCHPESSPSSRKHPRDAGCGPAMGQSHRVIEGQHCN